MAGATSCGSSGPRPVPRRKDSEGRHVDRGQPGSVACTPHIGRHEDFWKRVERPRTPYSVTQLNYLSDLITACPLPPLISRADFDSGRHLVSRQCRCNCIFDGKSSPSIRGVRGCDGGLKPHEDVAAPIVWCEQAELPCGARPLHCALEHGTASFNRCSEEGVEPARDDNRCVVQLEPGVTPKRGQCLRYHQEGAAVTRRLDSRRLAQSDPSPSPTLDVGPGPDQAGRARGHGLREVRVPPAPVVDDGTSARALRSPLRRGRFA